MLQIQVPVCFTYHMHVSMCGSRFRQSTDLQLCACSKPRHLLLPVLLYAFRLDTRPGYIAGGGVGRGAGFVLSDDVHYREVLGVAALLFVLFSSAALL